MSENIKQKNNLLLALIGSLLGIIALLAYYIYVMDEQHQQNRENITQKQKELGSTYTRLDSVYRLLNVQIRELQRFGSAVDSLVTIQRQIEKEKHELRLSKNLAAERYEKIKEHLLDYELLIKEKDAEILQLRAQNDKLRNENEGLKSKTETLASEVLEVKDQNKDLAYKAKAASTLRIKNLIISAIADNGRERNNIEFRTNQIDKLKISLQLDDNNFADKGLKKIYLKVLETNNITLFDLERGAGQFVFRGKKEFFTLAQEFLFDNTQQTIVFFYDNAENFKQGKYTVEILCEDEIIATAHFTVK